MAGNLPSSPQRILTLEQSSYSQSGLTKKAAPPPTRGVNRDSGTGSANGGVAYPHIRPRLEKYHRSQPFQTQMRLSASQKRSPRKTAANAQTPTVARTSNKPVIKESLNCSARETPERTPSTTPQLSCIQKLPRPCLCSLVVIACKWPNYVFGHQTGAYAIWVSRGVWLQFSRRWLPIVKF